MLQAGIILESAVVVQMGPPPHCSALTRTPARVMTERRRERGRGERRRERGAGREAQGYKCEGGGETTREEEVKGRGRGQKCEEQEGRNRCVRNRVDREGMRERVTQYAASAQRTKGRAISRNRDRAISRI